MLSVNLRQRLIRPAVFAALSLMSMTVPAELPRTSECVIVLHGLGRTAFSTAALAEALEGAGYRVWNESYASTTQTIDELARTAIGPGLTACEKWRTREVHFVTHSLGGILVRYYLQAHDIENLGRIVMLGPPNNGSEVVDLLRDNAVFEWLTGPAGQALGTDENSVPRNLKPIPGEIGIIAGNESSDPWFSSYIPGADDGKVSVASARLPEMADFLEVPEGHTFIMNNEAVIDQCLYFLTHGYFRRPEVEGRSSVFP